jgi:hypothetical protein
MAEGIHKAVATAMGEMKRLAKDSKNTEQKYDFASIDDFLAMTGPIMAKHGLFILMDEEAIEEFERQGKYNMTFWLRIRYSLTVYHVDGSSLPPVRRTVEVIRTGAQSSGSAQSYVLKQFQRALFNIPTGDKDDPDYGSAEGKPVAPPKNDDAAAVQAVAYLGEADTLDDLRERWGNLPKAAQSIPAVIKAKDAKKAALEASQPPAADLDDEIPY